MTFKLTYQLFKNYYHYAIGILFFISIKMTQNKHLKNSNIELNDIYGIKELSVHNGVVDNSGHNIFVYKDFDDSRKRPLAAAVIGLDNTEIDLPDQLDYYTGWTDSDAQEAYLQSKPKTFLILGKQGTGCYNLGEALSKKINCLHLCPKNVLIDEMDQNSPVGKCLDFNMRHNKVSKSDIILSLMKKKLQSPAVKHRGFIISGLPLVTSNKNLQYLVDNLYAEETLSVTDDFLSDLMSNLKKKKPKRAKKGSPRSSQSSVEEEAGEIEVEEEQEQEQEAEEIEEIEEIVVELPKFVLDSCSNHIFMSKAHCTTKESLLLHQIQDLFNFKPDIIVYISSPNLDIIIKRSHKFFNYINSSSSFAPFATNVDNEIRWPTNYSMIDYVKPIDIHTFNPKYNCKQPINFKKHVMDQICNYKNYIAPVIEHKLKDFSPNSLIKVDGRTSPHEMMNIVMERLLLMPIKPVLIPEPLYIEEPPEDLEEFWKMVEELNVIRSGVMRFNRYASLWYNRCPVDLQKRRSTQGNPKFAVIFFKHVYLLSTLNAMVSFCRNPRPYLQLKYLEPTCRVVILGTKSSGKTMIANCLSWLFTAPIICYSSILKTEKQKKYDHYAKNILSEIIATIEDNRFTKWQAMELQRTSDLNTWYNRVSSALSSYIPLLVKVTVGEENLKESPTLFKKFEALRTQLFFLPIDDLSECENALKNKQVLLNCAPPDLKNETSKPKLPNLGDEDVTHEIAAYIVANDLQKDIEPTVEEIMNEIIQIIKNLDTESLDASGNTYGKFVIDGFPSDQEYWGHLADSNLLPDYTIGLIENREIDADLFQHYTNIEKYIKNHQERFLQSSDVLIKTKLLHGKPADNAYVDVKILIDDIINDTFELMSPSADEKVPDTNAISSFTEAIDKFREEWDILKVKLEENSKCFVEVEIENKNDIEVLDDVMLKIRKCYFKPCANLEEGLENPDEDNESTKDILTYNDPRFLGETNIYCPLAFYEHGVLWEGKSELAASYDNKLYFFSKEESSEFFQHDITKYVCYNKPYKNNIPLRICVIGNIGSGKTSCSKIIAKELGLLHIDFDDFINKTLIPKHFKKVGWQYENSFTDATADEEEIAEFQLDEENLNYASDIMFNEQELRRMIYNYFERGSPLLSVLMQSLIKKLWNEKPFNDIGVVIDGYPKLPSDIEDMISSFCIPDIVVEIESSSETTMDRVSPKMFKIWKTQLNEAKLKTKNKLDVEKKEWSQFITRTVVIKLIIDEVLDNAVVLEKEEGPLQLSSLESTIFDAHPSGSANVDSNLFATYNELIQEYPEPIDQSVWETADDAQERINNRLESIFEIDDENIQTLKDILYEQKIKTVSVDGKRKLHKVIRNLLIKLSALRIRSRSFFEQTFITSCDIAEILLLEGFFLVSKFYRMCPVFISENPDTKFNPYNLNKRKSKIYPIIHRAYIYFVSSEESVKKFRTDPLKYINNEQIKSYKEHPLRIGIIGPPKSGKSKLVGKLAKRYGLISISKGKAIRHVLENMSWTVLGSTMISLLNEGKCIENDLIMKAVLIVAMDHRTMTNGFILDGFPETPFEVSELLRYGLFPLIMFDIQSDREIILENSQKEVYYNILKVKPPLSRPFIGYRYDKWFEKCSIVRNWINLDTQNLYSINGNISQWNCIAEAYSIIEETNKDIHYFLTYAKSRVISTKVMCISNEMFQQRMSCYKNLCPICFNKNILKHSGYPADKKGVIQYNHQFYWICPEHLNSVLNYPEQLLCSKTIDIPELPAVITTINTSLVYENGICIVTYAENLPSQNFVRGKSDHAVIYKKKIYLFCSSKCMSKFLSKPYMYCNIKVFKDTSGLPKLTLNKLPHLGYLEQTVGNILTEACCLVNVLRPKYPGLDTTISGILYLALYLKIHNHQANKAMLPIHSKTLKIYEAKCKLITDIGLRLRSIDNPFASYPKFYGMINKLHKLDSGTVRKPSSLVSSNTSRVPVPDERYDYLCEYHKPASKVPAFLNVVDIAGLVKGAAEGQGLGNAFLSHIKACDAIFNLCRAFDDESVIHVDGEVNPVRDLETIGEELRLKDEEQLIQHIEKLDRVVNRGGDKKLKPEFEALAKVKTILVDEKKHIRFGDWSAADIEVLNKYLFLTSKPALYLVNLSEKDYIRKKNKWLPKLKEWIDKNDPGAPLIPFSGALESKLIDMEPDEREKFLKENNITSALDKIIVQGYKALQLEYFFTAGADEVKAWTIQKGTKAPQAAGRIHTDFEKGFIMAEVMHYKDFKEEGSESACKSAGKYRQQGRNYVVDDGDIIFFKFNAGAGLKDAKKK